MILGCASAIFSGTKRPITIGAVPMLVCHPVTPTVSTVSDALLVNTFW